MGTIQSFLALFYFILQKMTKCSPCFLWNYKASNPEMRKLKRIGVDMEDAIFNKVESFFLDLSK